MAEGDLRLVVQRPTAEDEDGVLLEGRADIRPRGIVQGARDVGAVDLCGEVRRETGRGDGHCGLLLRGQRVAGIVPGPAAAVDDPDIREAHLLQHDRAQRGLAARPAREENSLPAILEGGVAARKLEVRLDVELAARDVARAWNSPVLGDLP